MQKNRKTVVFVGLLTLLCLSRFAEAQKTPELKDGQFFEAPAHLEATFQGWKRFISIKLDKAYIATLVPDGRVIPIMGIQIEMKGQWQTLSRHIGEQVSVSGKLQMNSESSYYMNGVVLMADKIALANGTVLHPKEDEVIKVPDSVTRYIVTVDMLPKHIEWPKHAFDTASGKALPSSDVDGCGLNGGGDVMNCWCAGGFHPTHAGIVPRAFTPAKWRMVPEADLPHQGMAQFGMPDEYARMPHTVQVVCERD